MGCVVGHFGGLPRCMSANWVFLQGDNMLVTLELIEAQSVRLIRVAMAIPHPRPTECVPVAKTEAVMGGRS